MALLAVSVKLFNDFPWALILNEAMGGIGMYALRIVILVLCIKVVLFPLDVYQKYKMRKNQIITKRIKPQMEKLEKAYANSPEVLQQKQAQLNKKEGMSYFASCIPMIITLIIFIWFWQTLSATAQYKQFEGFIEIYNVYTEAYEDNLGQYFDGGTNGLSDGYASAFVTTYSDEFENEYVGDAAAALDTAYTAAITANALDASASTDYYALYTSTYKTYFEAGVQKYISSKTMDQTLGLAEEAGKKNALSAVNTYCGVLAQNNVHDFYFGEGEYEGSGYKRDTFFWIKDIWSPDVPWTTSVKKTQAEFETGIGEYATNTEKSGIDETTLERAVSSYEEMMSLVIADERINFNGFLVLPVIAVGLNVLSQLISRKQQKSSGQAMNNDTQMGCMNNAMIFFFPIMIGYFALSYCAAFTLYMLTNTALSLLFNLITSLITRNMVPADVSVSDSGEMVEKYGRPDFSAK